MHDDYMNTEELAKFIGVSKQTVIHWRKKGWLMPDVIGKVVISSIENSFFLFLKSVSFYEL